MTVHLSLAPAPGVPHTRVISGPNPKLAMLRALDLRATDIAARAWTSIKTLGDLIARTPGWVGHAVLGILSTPAGYATTINTITLSIRAAYRIIDRGICLVGRLAAASTGAAAGSISTIAPTLGHTLICLHADTVDAVNSAYENLNARIHRFGEALQDLADTALVRSTATRTAALASALIVVNIITRGIITTRIFDLAPGMAGVVAAATSPWWLLLATGTVTVTAAAWAARTHLTHAGAGLPEDLDLIVNIEADGSITVTGIPSSLPRSTADQIAQQAITSALAKQPTGSPRRRLKAPSH